uniref:Uncharacterized protein n=1 Tax=Branchiostoma floridae TaxID=7739 RepID=C3XRW3_BRAFL|eukprot:XP_002613422.1 hypothetical protein BRAFLDRAFT_84543 [Branchiostoma floridae]
MQDSTGEHYRPFTDAHGRETTEADRPILKVSRTTGHGVPISPNPENSRGVVICVDCNKPRTWAKKPGRTTVRRGRRQPQVKRLDVGALANSEKAAELSDTLHSRVKLSSASDDPTTDIEKLWSNFCNAAADVLG